MLALSALLWSFLFTPHEDTLRTDQLAYSFLAGGNPDSAIYYYEKALTEGPEDLAIRLSILNNLAVLHKNNGDYAKALEYAFASIEHGKDSLRTYSSALNTIASIYYRQENFVEALNFHFQTLEIRKKMDFLRGVGMSLNNIGIVYNELGQYDSAINHFVRSLEIKESVGDDRGISTIYNNLGWAYLKMDRMKESEYYLLKSVQLKNDLGEDASLCYPLNLLSDLYLKTGQLDKSRMFLDSTRRMAEKYDDKEIRRLNAFNAAEYYRKTGQHDKQAEALNEYIGINEVLFSDEMARSLNSMQVKYETEKKDQEIVYLKEIESLHSARISTQQTVVWMVSGAAIFLLMATVLIAILLFQNRKRKLLIEHLNQEMQHRIKNNLQILSNLLKLQSQHLKDSNAVLALRTGESRINAMVLVHQLLFGSGDKRQVDLRSYVKELCHYLTNSFVHKQERIVMRTEIQDLHIDVDRVIPIGLIINELVTNSIKHAFEGITNPEVTISFRQHKNHHVLLEVADNGRGVSEDLLQKNQSFGMKLVQMLSNQLNAQRLFHNKNGAVFQFSIPLS